MGTKEFEDPDMVEKDLAGCHVVAPVSRKLLRRGLQLKRSQCPHDKECPLHHSGSAKLVCSFSQRLQRPAFIRKTKNVRGGHEDVGYSYVVVRRGRRPEVAANLEDSASLGDKDAESLNEQVRKEAYSWPRLVFPPMKNSGHVILDSCTAEGLLFRVLRISITHVMQR